MYLVAVPLEARPAGWTLADVLVPEDEDTVGAHTLLARPER
jgi:hypothetical protein